MSSPLHDRRARIIAAHQHPYKHTLDELAYSHPAIGSGVFNAAQAMNWVFAVLYPSTKAAVDTVADLPAVGNTLNDSRVVQDDGDGKAATYRWEQREGEASASWHKIYDMDWGYDSILSGFLEQTQDLYVNKYGRNDIDETGALLTGGNAGQHVYGGKAANSHLTLWANAGDGVGAATGYIQMGDNVRPKVDSVISLGTTTERWLKIWTDEITVGTMTITAGWITDTSGLIYLDTTNFSTLGYITAGTARMESGYITDLSGAISFDDENLTTTGIFTAGRVNVDNLRLDANTLSTTNTNGNLLLAPDGTGYIDATKRIVSVRIDVDNVQIDGNTISTTNTDGNLNLTPNGAGLIVLSNAATSLGITATGQIYAIGSVRADNLLLDGNTLSTTDTDGDLELTPNGSGMIVANRPIVPGSAGYDFGSASEVWDDIYVNGNISTGVLSIALSTIMTLRDITAGVGVGETIFWNGSKFVPSVIDTEVDHGTVSGLGDDDHTQYALLAGRNGGQTLNGGTAASDNLTLHSTSNASKGDILWHGDFVPGATDTYDIGTSAVKVKDIYMVGQARGLRVENFTTAGRPAAAAGTAGRIIYDSDLKDLYLDAGGTWRQLSIQKIEVDDAAGWTGLVAFVSYDMSAYNVDTRSMLWGIKDNSNNYEQMQGFVVTHTSSTNVTFTFGTGFEPPAGTYKIIGVG